MTYISGFVVPVPDASKQTYIDYSRAAWPTFRRFGALRQVECWGDDIPDGKLTDFRRAVQAKDDETVVFGWIEWPDRATADTSWQKMQDDPEMAQMGNMPFDGSRMIWGGFAPVFAGGKDEGAGYYSGFVLAVPEDKRQPYVEMAGVGWEQFRKLGALCNIECWGEDVPHGKLTDFYRATKAENDEVVVFAWIGWPDRATAEAGFKALQAEPTAPEMANLEMPFDGKRMFWGGFSPVMDSARAG